MEAPSLHTCQWLDLKQMQGSTILVTGATGLIGYNLLSVLSEAAEELGLKLLALVRDQERAEKIFCGLSSRIELIQGDVLQELMVEAPVHYVIHGASITSSAAFVNQPVETILTSVTGAQNMLEFARKKQVRSMVYLSSMEVYGATMGAEPLTESSMGYLDPMQLRSSYPQSKRMCETLCAAYAQEYGVNVKIARLAQTFGPGLQPTDRRAVVQFLTSAMNGTDIEIKASGNSARMYLHTFDAVTALLTLLLRGESGTAYNIANRHTYCSIYELAKTIAREIGSRSRVLVNAGSAAERRIYPPDSFLYLDTSRLESLGWQPQYDLNKSIHSLEEYMRKTAKEVDAT